MKKQLFSVTMLIFIIINFSYSYNNEHLKILLRKDISDAWDNWRKKNPGIKPDLSYSVITDCYFRGNFTRVNFKYVKISNCIAQSVDFSNSDFSFSQIKNLKTPLPDHAIISNYFNTCFNKSKIDDSELNYAILNNTAFEETEIHNTKIRFSFFINTKFLKSKIINSRFDENFQNVDFSHSQIKNTQIEGRKFFNINFRNAKITDSVIYAEKSNNLDFSQSNLIRVEFGCSRFTNVYFVNTNLPDSSFGDRNYPEAILTNVNFTNANLTNVNFQKAKFNNVIFKNADMTGAKLERKWYDYVKKQGVRNFDKIQWM